MKTNTVTNWMIVGNDGRVITHADNRAEARRIKNIMNADNFFHKYFFLGSEQLPLRIAKTVVTK